MQLYNQCLMNPKSSQFQQVNFDPIAYLNKKFPDEESLAGLDTQIDSLNAELADVNKQLIEQIHEHAMMNIQISEQIEKARKLSKEIINEIGIIKEKAKKSEEIVYDMCKDLKSLDIAKKNLTFSIDALKKFIMMVDAIEKLRDACENKQYEMIANLISAFNELSKYFKKYEQIPQIQSLYKEKNLIVEELFKVVIEDFEAYENQTTNISPEMIADAAKVIEVLGENYWRKFGQSINGIILKQYEEQYGNLENAVLQNTQRRFGFIKRKMQNFNDKFGKVIPIEWGMDCLLLYEFCSITRIHITNILERTSTNTSVAILMKALQLSIKFENKITDLMTKKYAELIKREKKNKYDLQALPRFAGSISNSFERYLTPYIKSEEETLAETLFKHLEDDKISELKVYNSALILFHGVKNSVRRASNFSKGALLLDILKVVKKMFVIYSERCFQKSRRCQADNFEETICWIVNTGQYCKNIIEGVREVFEGAIDPAFADNIEFANEELVFSNLISRSIEALIATIEQKMEASLSQMSRVQWQKIEDMSDVSCYIKEVKQTLKTNFLRIKEEMEPTYLTFYMNKIVSLAANKLIQNIYKCKKLPFSAYQFLQMDITEIKETLVSVVKADQKTYANQKNLQSHMAFVNKSFSKPENIIKLMQLPDKEFAERYEMFMEGGSVQDLERILQVRGSKKNDFSALAKSVESKNI